MNTEMNPLLTEEKKERTVKIKFKNDILPTHPESLNSKTKLVRELPELAAIFESFPTLNLTRSLRDLQSEPIKTFIGYVDGKSDTDEGMRLVNYYKTKQEATLNEINDLIHRLGQFSIVEVAYEESPIAFPNSSGTKENNEISIVNPDNNPLFNEQGYLKAAPSGIDAEYTWSIPGGAGEGVTFVDVEGSWLLDHEDLVEQHIEYVPGSLVNKRGSFHGTPVMGQIMGMDNDIGIIGSSPKATAKVSSMLRNETEDITAQAILNAGAVMSSGDILLVEVHTLVASVGNYVPVEQDPEVFDVIKIATDKGIIVVEPAGNGYSNLDEVVIRDKKIFNRNSEDFKDSGAIMIGAAGAGANHYKLVFSNYGNRIDSYGWGEAVTTINAVDGSNEKNLYTHFFSGTSSASPIVAGAAVNIQGILKAKGEEVLSPKRMRELLSNQSLGTISYLPNTDQIGVMPNLKAIVNYLEDPIKNRKPIIKTVDTQIDAEDVFSPLSMVISATDEIDGNLLQLVQLTATYMFEKGHPDKPVELDLSVPGTYKIVFSVTNSVGNEGTAFAILTINSIAPVIKVENKLIKTGEMFQPMSLVISAFDRNGNDITDQVRLGKVYDVETEKEAVIDTTKERVFRIEFSVTDFDGRSGYANAFLIVKSEIDDKPVIILKDKSIMVGDDFEVMSMLICALDREDGDITKSVARGESYNVQTGDNEVFDISKVVAYVMRFYVIDSDGNMIIAIAKLTVEGNGSVPEIQARNADIVLGEPFDVMEMVVSALDKKDGDITDQVKLGMAFDWYTNEKVNLDLNKIGKYKLAFYVVNSDKNIAMEFGFLTIESRTDIVTENAEIQAGDNYNPLAMVVSANIDRIDAMDKVGVGNIYDSKNNLVRGITLDLSKDRNVNVAHFKQDQYKIGFYLNDFEIPITANHAYLTVR